MIDCDDCTLPPRRTLTPLPSLSPSLLCPPDLSDPIDVYSEWIDQTEKVNADVAKGHRHDDDAYEDDDEEIGARGRDDDD